MPGLTHFSDSFWGTGFTSSAGFDALVQRMNEGKKLSRELEDYFRQRGKLESSYSQDLMKLFKSLKMKEVVDTIEKTWNSIKAEVEKMAESHSKAASSFQKQSEEMKKFAEVQTVKKRQLEDHVKRYQQNKNNMYTKCMNNKKNYNQKCQERDTAKSVFEANRQSVTITAKELEKLRMKKEKSEEEKSKADLAYQSSLDALEHARMEWENAFQTACNEFQSLEEERIAFMREEMWKSTNIDSLTAVSVDESSETIRKVLETCQVEEDISRFIEKCKTGQERPAKIQYENYYGNVPVENNVKSHATPPANRAPQPIPSQGTRPAPPQSRAPDARIVDVEQDSTYSTIDSSARITPIDDNQLYHTLEMSDDTGTVVSPMSYSGMCTVVHPYVAKNASELTVTTGSKVIFVRNMANGFIQVVEEGTKKYGLIPERCVQKFEVPKQNQENPPLIDFL
ncbi:proline-serine-threonine phosphatase-interacting protein 2-like isoform X2 [Gigantopelta aegis]|uniref:proline-serine-threonine phosphatase-interacting protein 2-like isoform X2 n=1 Tax=Gigantopelta aegis TaxID=1735272 RepID=UPI001B88BC66|nr:proline-serine-threonine phosphatase-interacting protein 2-like isoform X2 [Gigantopelta aegis]